MTLMKWIQALMLSFSLIFIFIFVYLFIANDQLHMFSATRTGDVIRFSKGDRHSLVFLSAEPTARDPNEVIESTKFGQIKGFVQSVFSRKVRTFLGIPFASPPLGNLRFKRTVPPQPWGVPISAKHFKPKCAQAERPNATFFEDLSPGMSEDCLYLNIWAPEVAFNHSELNPVMVWFHGNSFFTGSANSDETDGRVLAAFSNVVVVTFEYRVGALGFLDLGTDHEVGNQGLYDQVAAIRWVRDNIGVFGGDGGKISLFGDSSGALAIGLHLVSPESRHLFSRVILESGSPLQLESGLFKAAEKTVPELVRRLKCLNDSGDEHAYNVECLRTKQLKEILDVSRELSEKFLIPFPPTTGTEFLPLSPRDVIKSEQREDRLTNLKEVLIGTNSKSSALLLKLVNKENLFAKNSNSNSKEFNNFAAIVDLLKSDDVMRQLFSVESLQIDLFVNNLFSDLVGAPFSQWLDRLVDVLSDKVFVCPQNVLINELASLGKKVFVYQFTQQSRGSLFSDFAPTLHDEVPFVFGHPLRYPLRYSGQDIDLSKRIMSSWSHFARTGEPLPQLDIDWRPNTTEEPFHVKLSFGNATQSEIIHRKSCEVIESSTN